MAVISLSVFRFKPDISLNAAILSDLRNGKAFISNASGNPCHYFTQVEDPSLFYLIAGWNSVSEHVEHILPTRHAKQVLAMLRQHLDLFSMNHVDVEMDKLPLHASSTLSIARHSVSAYNKRAFERIFNDEVKGILDSMGQWGAGWRPDKEHEEREEFVLVGSWRDGPRCAAYGRLMAYVDSLHLRHIQRVDV